MRAAVIIGASVVAHLVALALMPAPSKLRWYNLATVEPPPGPEVELVEVALYTLAPAAVEPPTVSNTVESEVPEVAPPAGSSTVDRPPTRGAIVGPAVGRGDGNGDGSANGAGNDAPGPGMLSMRGSGEGNGADLTIRTDNQVIAGILAKPPAPAPDDEAPRRKKKKGTGVKIHIPPPHEIPEAVANHLEAWSKDPVTVSRGTGMDPFTLPEITTHGVASQGKADGWIYTIASGTFGSGGPKEKKRLPRVEAPEDDDPARLMLANLDRIRDRDPATQRRLAYELWRECDEGEAGDAARAAVLRWVRVYLPEGTDKGYAADELERLDPRFRPYE